MNAIDHTVGMPATWTVGGYLDDEDDSMRPIMWDVFQAFRHEGVEWPPHWDKEF